MAFANLKNICEEYLQGQYTIEIIDLSQKPHLAKEDHIVALPTLVDPKWVLSRFQMRHTKV